MLTYPQEQEKPKLPLLVKSNKVLSLAFNNECSMMWYKSPEQKAFLTAHLIDNIAIAVSLLNVTRNLNPTQIKYISKMIVEEKDFRQMKPSEIIEAVNRGVKGQYGKHYEGIGIDTVYSWLRKYQEERFEEIERYRQKETSQAKIESMEVLKSIPTEVLSSFVKPAELKSRANEKAFAAYEHRYKQAEMTATAELKKKMETEIIGTEEQLEFRVNRINELMKD